MARLALLEILLFALPFLLFMFWRLSMKATEEIGDHKPAPTIILSAIGGFLAAAGFVFMVLTSHAGDSEHTTYVPPSLSNGGIDRAEFNNNPGEAPPRETRIFAQPDTDQTGDDEDDDDSPQPR
ncbi:MAG: hypothetical protein DHS20C06_15410 [Hyphobacterium sp.]|nr:MAG: hypothetical protein DHS20C06_15410 [Hyphobacterium sp.]